MNLIDSVMIKGFWGNHEVSFKASEDLNFLIGPNGSGKSTTLKIISGVLRADKDYLSELDFESVRINLKDPRSKRKPYIEVVKNLGVPFFHCDYKIVESSTEKPYAYVLSDVDGYDTVSKGSFFIRAQLAGSTAASRTLAKHLSEMVSLTWLSVQRAASLKGPGGNDPVDLRLDDFSNRLVRYLSSLSKQVNALHERFQEHVFLSLLVKENDKVAALPGREKVDSEKQALLQIFSEFKLDKRSYQKKLDGHFGMLEDLRGRWGKSTDLKPADFMAIFSLHRIESTVDVWEGITKEKNRIVSSRDLFLAILNKLLLKKTISLNERNELVIKTESGKILKPSQLSSGEKQIIVILGEALLQEGQSFIYMADEPEISLHVAWQESLAKNIKSLNPAAQIVFATHSPDVVGANQDRLIHMDRCVK
ncbi:ATP-binding protein [Pseudomonas sp. GD03651]|uniref:ATP-binding protein n=4 Tax=Pseudomonas TaxID=286 RepID=A0A7W2KE05_9PSED|nr:MULTISPECIES: AAA family ATPase [Pseudomonas]MBA6060217.1 ATP-binding protein [Pseudomonas juntendi]MBA6096754.1 ATP-binding protein [Pseudomonas juntendi]MBA6125025.1 ATP-binding protein [Pseudomonas juntendi]MCE0862869.1 ATP-binding protein [Pseudomonas alloputida]MCE0868717.1 ATP-binding protein [Pseudomonas alloputida]